MTTRFDAIVIGTGQSGPSLAHRLTEAGRQVAVDRAQALRRHLRQQRLHPDQDPDRERPGGACRAPRGRVRRRDRGPVRVDMKAVKARKDAIVRVSNEGVEEGLRENPRHHRLRRPRALRRRRSRCAVGDDVLEAEQIFINVGGRADIPPIPGIDDRALSRQLLDDGGRLPARAPGDPRRQLHRPRVRPDVPPLRQRGDDHPARPAAGPARGRGRLAGDPRDPRGRGHPDPDRRRRDAGREPGRRGRGRR